MLVQIELKTVDLKSEFLSENPVFSMAEYIVYPMEDASSPVLYFHYQKAISYQHYTL
jgi:hypothetical protein